MEAFEGEFMPWEFGYLKWNLEDARKPTRWLMEKLPEEITYYDFQKNKLRTAFEGFYSSSPKEAIMDAIYFNIVN